MLVCIQKKRQNDQNDFWTAKKVYGWSKLNNLMHGKDVDFYELQ